MKFRYLITLMAHIEILEQSKYHTDSRTEKTKTRGSSLILQEHVFLRFGVTAIFFVLTGSVISLCNFWFGLKWHSNVSYIWKQDVFITTKTHHLIWNISWCQLILFLSSKLTWSKQAIFHYFSNDFYLKLSFYWN